MALLLSQEERRLDEIFDLVLPRRKYYELKAEELPEAQLVLLSHQGMMTEMLERISDEEVVIDILERRESDKRYFRKVLLKARSGQSVGYAIIYVLLGNHPPEARRLIREGVLPYGKVLKRCGIEDQREIIKYFRVHSREVRFFSRMKSLLSFSAPIEPYGRDYYLRDVQGRILSRVIEIFNPYLFNPYLYYI